MNLEPNTGALIMEYTNDPSSCLMDGTPVDSFSCFKRKEAVGNAKGDASNRAIRNPGKTYVVYVPVYAVKLPKATLEEIDL